MPQATLAVFRPLVCLIFHMKPASEFNRLNKEFTRWLEQSGVSAFRSTANKKTGFFEALYYQDDAEKVIEWFGQRVVVAFD